MNGNAERYAIRLRGQLPDYRAAWFEGMELTYEENDTLITGPVIDQAALFGLLDKIRDLGLPLLSVNRIESRQ